MIAAPFWAVLLVHAHAFVHAPPARGGAARRGARVVVSMNEYKREGYTPATKEERAAEIRRKMQEINENKKYGRNYAGEVVAGGDAGAASAAGLGGLVKEGEAFLGKKVGADRRAWPGRARRKGARNTL